MRNIIKDQMLIHFITDNKNIGVFNNCRSCSISSSLITAPVGLCGELRMIAFVFGEIHFLLPTQSILYSG